MNGAIKLYSRYSVIAVLTAEECVHVSYSKIILIWKLQNTTATATEGSLLPILLQKGKITLVILYAPNDDSPEFFDKVFDTLKEFNCESLIIGGDFNCVPNPILDKKTAALTRNQILVRNY